MARSPLEDLPIAALVREAQREERSPPPSLRELRNGLRSNLRDDRGDDRNVGAGIDLGVRDVDSAFRGDSVEARLSEIDELLEDTLAPSARAASFSLLRDSASAPRMMLLDASIRALPGGEAFRALQPPESRNVLARAGLGLRELYQRVRQFLQELRDGLFGFDRALLSTPGDATRIAMSFDSDVTMTLAADPSGDAAGLLAAAALVQIADAVRDALALFAKVVEILVLVIRAATNPASAVRTLWRALRKLYGLLVDHFKTANAAT